MLHTYRATLIPLFLSSLIPCSTSAQCPTPLWADEFDGTTLDATYWTHEIGDGCDQGICGWGNEELQYYQPENTEVSDGTLKITARPEQVDSSTYTSSRIVTKNKFDLTYGYIESRFKVPAGNGTWPALWMLSTEEPYGGWPRSGEIDIMEFVGRDPDVVFGTVHYGQVWPNNASVSRDIRLNEPVPEDFHVIGVEWKEDTLRWFLDGYLFNTTTRADLAPERWPFDHDFHFLVNLAVGGRFGGPVDAGAFPATYEVDYLRVFDATPAYLTGPRNVTAGEAAYAYRILGLPAGTAVNWTVPEGATITSGQGEATIDVTYTTGGAGTVMATYTDACGEARELMVPVISTGAFVPQSSLENFDDESPLTPGFTNGTLTEVANPVDNDSLNPSAIVGRYVRNAEAQYDVLVYETGQAIDNGDAYADGDKRFYIDVYTDEQPGTEILLQLETATSQGDNYPTGRHSRYRAETEVSGAWHRLQLEPLDRPDPNADASAITNLILLFAPNTFGEGTYFYDNLDIYAQATTSLFGPSEGRGYLPLQVSPNPASGRVRLNFDLPTSGERGSVDVFTSDGRRLDRFELGRLPSGRQAHSLDVSGLSTGAYHLRLRTPSYTAAATLAVE